MGRRLALCVGINDYPGSGNDLSGCINDAKDWAGLLVAQGYEVTTLLDAQATRAGVVSELNRIISTAKFGDKIVFTYSGHGSWVPDRNGDEEDARDECIVLYDWESSGFLTDDEIYALFQTRKFGVRVWQISDSCFSGTVYKNFQKHPVRFFPPSKLLNDETLPEQPSRVVAKSERPSTLLFSGSSDLEYSYDAVINGRPNGAFTAAAMAAFQPGTTATAWFKRIRNILPSDEYPQTPGLQCSSWQKYGKL